jgi:tight adherence protein B
MTSMVISILIFFTATWFLCPRLFLFQDRRVAHRHSLHLISQHSQQLASPTVTKPRVIKRASQHKLSLTPHVLSDYAHCLDSLARATRSHQPTRDALLASLSLLTETPTVTRIVHDLHNGQDVECSLVVQDCDQHEQQFLEFLRVALVQQVFIPQALEQAADIMRDDYRHHQELTAATAQARSSASLLTFLPFIVLALLLLTSATARRGSLTAPFVLTIGIGVVVNRLGWWWIQRMVHHSGMSTADLSSSLTQQLCVSLRAGVSLRTAVEDWAKEHDPLLYQALVRGDSLSTALHDFRQRHTSSSHHLVQVLLEADRDGLPVVHTVGRLSLEMRTHRRHQADIKIRQLPTKLTLPVVLCVLPSFIFLTVVPIILANLSNFTLSPPPMPSIS